MLPTKVAESKAENTNNKDKGSKDASEDISNNYFFSNHFGYIEDYRNWKFIVVIHEKISSLFTLIVAQMSGKYSQRFCMQGFQFALRYASLRFHAFTFVFRQCIGLFSSRKRRPKQHIP